MGSKALAVFRQVGKRLDEFIVSKDPNEFSFSAKSDEAGRVSLYNKLSDLLAKRHGYSVKMLNDFGYNRYYFTKNVENRSVGFSFDEEFDKMFSGNYGNDQGGGNSN